MSNALQALCCVCFEMHFQIEAQPFIVSIYEVMIMEIVLFTPKICVQDSLQINKNLVCVVFDSGMIQCG